MIVCHDTIDFKYVQRHIKILGAAFINKLCSTIMFCKRANSKSDEL